MAKIDSYPQNDSGPQEARVITQTDIGAFKHALDVFLAGGSVSSIPGGLSTSFNVKLVPITSVGWTSIAPLAGRQGIGIQNETASAIKVRHDGVGGYVGWTININGELFLDVTDGVAVYVRAAAGSPTITVLELG